MTKLQSTLNILFLLGLSVAGAVGQTTERISLAPGGLDADGASSRPSVSASGRYVAFVSGATNLVPGDTNGLNDIFVRDTETGGVVRISVALFGAQPNAKSDRPSISADGRFVVFYSDAWNLVPGDTQTFDLNSCPLCTGRRDIFIHDRDPDANGVFDEGPAIIERLSISSAGFAANGNSTRPVVSDDGRYVAFRSSATNLVPGVIDGLRHVYLHDRVAGLTTLIDAALGGVPANARSDRPAISGDGRFVAFFSDATNLIVGDGPVRDVFLRDRDPDVNGVFDEGNGVISRISVSSAGVPGNAASGRPTLSGDGRYIEFASFASNLVPGDTNNAQDEFVHDRITGKTVLISLPASGGATAGPGPDSNRASISLDARYVAYTSAADDLVPGDTNAATDIFVTDQLSGQTVRVSVSSSGVQGDASSDRPSISDNGRYVTFSSDASNLVLGDIPTFDPVTCPTCTGVRDIFVHDRDPDANGIFDQGNGVTTRVSVSTAGVPADRACSKPSISDDGRFVSFESDASNLGGVGDTGFDQIFVHDRVTGVTAIVSAGLLGGDGDAGSSRSSLSSDGRYVAFLSDAANLVIGDEPTFDPSTCPTCTGSQDIFVRDRDPDANGIFDEPNAITIRVSVSTAGTPGNATSGRPSISGDGRYVAFHSDATNLVLADTNAQSDVFVHELATGATIRASVLASGVQGNFKSDRPRLSADGRFVVYRTKADNLIPGDTPSYDESTCPECTGARDVVLLDRDPDQNGIFDEGANTTTLLSVTTLGGAADLDINGPMISGDGSAVVFNSLSGALVAGDTNLSDDIFIRDTLLDSTERVSVDSSGFQAESPAGLPDSDQGQISADARYVVFRSAAANLVPGDTNAALDIFVHDRDPDANGVFDEPGSIQITRASVSSGEAEANSSSDTPRISADGSHVVFASLATNLGAGDLNLLEDVLMRVQKTPPCPGDLAEPFGVLDFSDIIAFLVAFGASDPIADMAPPFGVFDFSDVIAFLTAFAQGCP